LDSCGKFKKVIWAGGYVAVTE